MILMNLDGWSELESGNSQWAAWLYMLGILAAKTPEIKHAVNTNIQEHYMHTSVQQHTERKDTR